MKSKKANDSHITVEHKVETEENSFDVKLFIANGINKSNSKDYNSALNLFNKAIEVDPNNYDAYLERSKVKLKLNDEKGSKQDLNIAGVLIEKLDAGLKAYDTGIEKYDASDFNGAVEFFSKSIALNVIIPENFYYRGLSKKYIDDIDGALQDFNKTIEIDPNFAKAYYNRGKIKYHKLKDIEGALVDYDKAIQLNSNDDDIYVSRAIVKSSIGNFEGALQDCNKAIEINPSKGETYFSRAMEKFKQRDYNGSIMDLDIVINLGLPDDSSFSLIDAHSIRGGLKSITHDFEGAVNDFSKAIQLDPNNGKLYFERSEARKELGQTEQSLEDKLKAFKLGYEETD